MKKHKTIFCDIDGTIFKYRKFEDIETVKAEPIQSTIDYLKKMKDLLENEEVQAIFKNY